MDSGYDPTLPKGDLRNLLCCPASAKKLTAVSYGLEAAHCTLYGGRGGGGSPLAPFWEGL